MAETVEKKGQPLGLLIFGLLSMLSGISASASNIYFLSSPIPEQVEKLLKYAPNILWPVQSSISLALGVLSIVIGYNLIKRKNLWRKIAIITCIIAIAYWLFSAFFLSRYPRLVLLGGVPFFDIALLIYLTREKVKDLFDN